MDQVATHHEAAKVTKRVAAEIREQRPVIFVGLKLSSEPTGPAELYIKGPAGEFVRSLVGKASAEVKIVDEQPFSQKELDARQRLVSDSLAAQGYKDTAVWYDLSGGGRINAEIARQPGLSDDPAEISFSLPPDIRDTVDLTLRDSAVGELQDAFGGMSIPYAGYDPYCTSGWSVWNASGTTGVTTAGHCGSGIYQIKDPATGLIPLTYQAGHQGQWGDVEWLTSNALEPGKLTCSPKTVPA